jgi:hypothetical protein
VIYGYEVDGDIWIWSGWWYMDMKWMVIYGYEVPGGALNLRSTEIPRPWSPWESTPSRKNPQGRTGKRTRDLMISSQKLWPRGWSGHEKLQAKIMQNFHLRVLHHKHRMQAKCYLNLSKKHLLWRQGEQILRNFLWSEIICLDAVYYNVTQQTTGKQ